MTLRIVRPEYDDEGDYIPSERFHRQPMETPEEMAGRQAAEARDFLAQVRSGKNLRFPWPDLDAVIGPLLPGWLVAVGGRAKAGKTTLLRELLTAWTELGKTVVYVGTETEAAALRLQWAATRLGLSFGDVIDARSPQADVDRVLADVSAQTNTGLVTRAIFGEMRDGTVDDLTYWVEYARIGKADVLIFDHLGRLELGIGEQWQAMGRAVRLIKNIAVQARMTIVCGAQLTQGEGGSVLGEHEVPGNGSWAASANIQRECDVGIQLWKPFKSGVTGEQKRAAKEDQTKIADIIQPNVMAIRVSAHRYRGDMATKSVRLHVERDQIHSYTTRAP